MADQILKQWNVTSGNPRDSHAEMDGEEVPINEPFSNGLMYPGDPTGDVGEVAGCTCVMTISGTAVAPTEVPGSRQVFATPRSLNEMVDEAEKVRETYPAEVADSHAIPLTTAELRAGEVSDTARAWDARIAEYGSSSDETVQLYRAVPKEVADQLKVGEQFTDRGFLYAHEDPGIGTAFPDGAAMQLNIPPGMKWIYGDSFPGERILGRDITWEVSDDRFVTVINSRGEATEMRMFTLTPQEAAAEVADAGPIDLNVANRDTLIEDWKSERQKWLDSLPSDLRTRAEDFESTRMYGLNAALRGGTSVPISSIDYTVENGVEDLINHGVVTEEPTVYFRGLGTQTMEVGDTYVDHGYAFMSRSPGVAAEFTHGVADAPILRITVEPGARSFFGNYTHYTESIFERDMEFEVTGQTTGFVNVWKDGRAVSTEFPVLEVTARAPERAIAEAVTTEEPTVTQAVTDSYDSMSATDLRAELRSRGLPTSFNKPQLIEMLRADDGVGSLAESATTAPVAASEERVPFLSGPGPDPLANYISQAGGGDLAPYDPATLDAQQQRMAQVIEDNTVQPELSPRDQQVIGSWKRKFREVQYDLRGTGDPIFADRVTTAARWDVSGTAWDGRTWDKVAGQEAYVQRLDDLIASSHTTNEVTVYRGVAADANFALTPGDIVQDNGYVSTTLTKKYARGWVGNSNYVYEITLPPDMPALATDYAGVASNVTGSESELMLPRGTQFEVQSVEGTNIKLRAILPGDTVTEEAVAAPAAPAAVAPVAPVPATTVPPVTPTPEPTVPAPARDYESMSASDLRDELRARGYPTSYSKPRLIEMLQEDDNLTSPDALVTPDTSLIEEDVTAPRKPFKTTQEAEDYVAQVMRTVQEAEGGTAVPFPTHFTWENLAGETKTLKPAVANAIADAMDELAAKAPGSLSKLLSLRVEVDPSVGDAYAWVDSKYPGTIVLNGDIMGGNLGRIEGLLTKDVRHGFAATDGIEGLISHELGHVTMGTSGFAGAAEMLKDAGFTMDMYETAGSWLSKYAASSKAEFMGELYSAAVTGVANERLGQELIDGFRQQLIKNGYLEAVTP